MKAQWTSRSGLAGNLLKYRCSTPGFERAWPGYPVGRHAIDGAKIDWALAPEVLAFELFRRLQNNSSISSEVIGRGNEYHSGLSTAYCFQERSGRRPRPACFHGGPNPPARPELPANNSPHRIAGLNHVFQHLVDDVFLKDAQVAVTE